MTHRHPILYQTTCTCGHEQPVQEGAKEWWCVKCGKHHRVGETG